MERLSDEELDMLIDLNQDKYCQNHYDFTVQKAANELKELREFKEVYQKGMDYSYATYMYRKAIDDFAEKIAIYGTYDDYGNVVHVLEIAEKLKKRCTEWN